MYGSYRLIMYPAQPKGPFTAGSCTASPALAEQQVAGPRSSFKVECWHVLA